MTAADQLPRRPFILDEGEQLLVTQDALVAVERLGTFVDETGLAPEGIVADPLVTVPLPIYSKDARFSTIHPTALWNPLFWLPEEIALRFRIRESENSEPRPETDAEWALRVAIELSEGGLYDAEGGWLDVFALYGIDIDNPIDRARVEAWQAGLPDEDLDSIDLRQFAVFTEDHQAFHQAQELYPLLASAQWGYTASSLHATIEADPENVATYAALAAEMLLAEPGTASDVLFEAARKLQAGEPAHEHGPKVMEALSGVVAEYVDAIYELERA